MPDLKTIHHFDVIIVGSGGAGLSLALSLPSHYNIAILAKAELTEASTFYAQGGVAAVLDETDSIQQHINDTMIAGGHLCELDAVKHTVEGGKPSVDFLLNQGVQFTLDDDEQLHLTREGGHSQRRIIHSADATGKAISTTLVERAKERKNITIFENYIAIDLITLHKLGHQDQTNRAIGLYALDEEYGSILWKSADLIDEYGTESCSFTDDGNLIVGNLFNIICINATNGETIWQTPRPDAAPTSGGQEVSVYGNRGYFWIADFNGPKICVINIETGEILYSSESVSGGLVQQICPFIGSDGTVYVPRAQSNIATDFIVAYEDNGIALIEKWRVPIGWFPFSTSGEGPDGSIYTYSSQGELIRLNPADGSILNISPPFLFDEIHSPRLAIDNSGQIFVTNGGLNGTIYSFNPDLTLSWAYNVGILNHSGPALADNGTLVISSSTHVFAFEGSTLDLGNISTNEFSIYPNPTVNYLFINGLNEYENVTIYDMTGQLIYNAKVSNNQIDVRNFQNGIYILIIETEKGIITKKFVKQ